MDGDGIGTARRRRWPRRLGVAGLALLLLIALGLAILWPMRVELARNYIDGELARRGVRARYEVKRIGFGSEIFENLVIGDPGRPDLTARHVEVQLLIGFTGPRVGLITARGVRMRGRIENGRLRLGEIDKLLGPPSGAPFRLPDQRVEVRDAALDLATPAGIVSLALSGRGNLSNGFRGAIAVAARELRVGKCVLTRPVARLTLRIEDLRPRVHGPAGLARLACGGNLAAERPLFALQAILAPGLDHWRGAAAPADVRSQKEQVKIQRRARYTQLAAQRGATIEEVAAATACQLFASRAGPDQYYRLPDGVWRRRNGSEPVPRPSHCG